MLSILKRKYYYINRRKIGMFNFGKGLYYKCSWFLGLIYALILIPIFITAPIYIHSSGEVQESFNFFYMITGVFFILTSFIIPQAALILIIIELFLTGKLSLKVRGKNYLLSILKFTLFIIFQTVLIIIIISNSLIVFSDINNYIIQFFVKYLFPIISFYCLGVFVRKKAFKKSPEEMPSTADSYNTQIIEQENNFDIIIFSILLYLLLIHFLISGMVFLIEQDILKGQITVETKYNFFKPEQKAIEYIKRIKNNNLQNKKSSYDCK